MMFDVIIVAFGKSERMGLDKLSYEINGQSILSRTINTFDNIKNIANIIVVTDKNIMPKDNIILVKGGSSRSQSVQCGLAKVTSPYVLIHDGARPFASKNLIEKIMADTEKYNSAIPYLKSTDSTRKIQENKLISCIDREEVVGVQTPQGFSTKLIKKAYELSNEITNTDESELFLKFIEPPHASLGEISNRKITYIEDLVNITSKVGSGFDVHKFEKGKKLILGGIEIPYHLGLKAHSDGDVVIHAIMDALLSAIDERDIGVQFPDTDSEYKNINSCILLEKVKNIMARKNATINNITITIMAQSPILKSYIPLMQTKIASILNISENKINITATTTETLGIIGEKKGIAVLALASVI
jgi:2-C-methyl-D-erythritol 4-phosphate cytidylyltransferase/2-C-methyl-D-erythritol 2,4-cyclodiphosphate synthase